MRQQVVRLGEVHPLRGNHRRPQWSAHGWETARMKFKHIGNQFVAIWTADGLGRKVVAINGQTGATHGREQPNGEWRWSAVPGSKQVVFTEIGQLVSFVKLMRQRE